MKTPEDGFAYVTEEGEVYLPDDLPTLVSDDEDEQQPTPSASYPIQHVCKPDTIDMVVLCRNLG